MIYLRGSYKALMASAGEEQGESIFGMAIGAGLKYQLAGINFRFDYTFRDVEYFQGNNTFCLGVAF